MLEILSHLFDPSGFPRRWDCGDWSDELGWLHILSDLGVWLAYVAIPCVLGYFVIREEGRAVPADLLALRRVHPGVRLDAPDGGDHLLVAGVPAGGGAQAVHGDRVVGHGDGAGAGDAPGAGDAEPRGAGAPGGGADRRARRVRTSRSAPRCSSAAAPSGTCRRARSSSAPWPTRSRNWRGWPGRTGRSSGTTGVGTNSPARPPSRCSAGAGSRSTTPRSCPACWRDSGPPSPAASRGRTRSRSGGTTGRCAGTSRAPCRSATSRAG